MPRFKRDKGPYKEAIQVLMEHMSEKELANVIDRLIYTYKTSILRRSRMDNITPEDVVYHYNVPNGDIIADLIQQFSQRKARKFRFIYDAAMPHIFRGRIRPSESENVHINNDNLDFDIPIQANEPRIQDRDILAARRTRGLQRVPRDVLNSYTTNFARVLETIHNRGVRNHAESQSQSSSGQIPASAIRRG